MAIVPDLQAPDIAALSESDAQRALDYVIDLLASIEPIEKLSFQANLDGTAIAAAPSRIDFFRRTLQPGSGALFHLAALLDPDSFFENVEPPEESPRQVWEIFASGMDLLRKEGWPPEDPIIGLHDLEAADNLLSSPFFSPDDWRRNAEVLDPIVGNRAGQALPSNIRVRIKELYRSFVLGNYLATAALARAILEYALVDRSTTLGIDPYSGDPRHPDRIRRLRELVEDVSERRPQLRGHMECILDAGNQTLHPRKKDNLVRLPSALRQIALKSVQAIRAVIEELYLHA